MLELRRVSKRFAGGLAVDEVTFAARASEITGYLGPNGSGKSTTIKMIAGLLDRTAGEILFKGVAIDRDVIAWKQRVGYVPEEPHLYAHLSALEYLVMIGQLRDLPARTTVERIEGLLHLLGLQLHDVRYVPLSAFSKGMRQKVLLVGALLHDPELGTARRAVFWSRRERSADCPQPGSGARDTRQGRALQLSRA